MKKCLTLIMLNGIVAVSIHAQNIGVGVPNPTEKLEVAGTIYTNSGGIKFPDETIQTTAAYNSEPESAALPYGIGFIEFTLAALEGPYDTLGKTDVSLLYNFNWDVTQNVTNPVFSPIHVVKQIDKSGPNLMKHFINQATSSNVYIYLTRKNTSGNLEIYAEVKATNFVMLNYSQTLTPGGNGGFAHVEYLDLNPQTIQIKNLISGSCYCWNVMLNAPCTCSS